MNASTATALRGARDALALPAWMVALSVFGIGSLARDVGYPAEVAFLSTILMWAGPAQTIFFGAIASGTSGPAIALAITLSSIRFLPMTMSLMPLLRRPGDSVPRQLLIAHYIAVTVWVEGLRRLPAVPEADRTPYFLGFANACILLSAFSTLLGFYLIGALPRPLAAALLFLTPIYFTIALTAAARSVPDWIAVGLGFALAPLATPLVGKDFDLLAIGLVGGTAAYLADLRRRRA